MSRWTGIMKRRFSSISLTATTNGTSAILTHKNHGFQPSYIIVRGTIEVDTTNADEPTVTFELSIDGQKAWEYKVVGQPVKWAGSTSLSPATIAGSVKEGVKNAISKLGRIFG